MLQRLNTAVTDSRDPAAALSVAGLCKRFANIVAVQDVSIDILPGEFVSLLGPSGCGKTTVLRAIAGLEQPDSGTIRIGSQVMNDVPIYRRDIGMVFQNYALFPHMTVAENVGFGLRVRAVPLPARRAAVTQALEMVRLGAVTDRLPKQLSGGQRQRVAIARALVTHPRLLLLDEPLGALDRKLREQMQLELKLLQRSIGITTVMVTHDQEEALTLSDRLVVMNAGKVVQSGTPETIYRNPNNAFIADFIGTSNFFTGVVVQSAGGTVQLRLQNDMAISLPPNLGSGQPGESVSFFIRPENLFLTPPGAADGNGLQGHVLHVAYSGAVSHCYVDIGLAQPVGVLLTNTVAEHRAPPPGAGDEVCVRWAPGGLTVLGR